MLLGEQMIFVRTAACNLSCSWCDSSYTWKGDYVYHDMTVEDILLNVGELYAKRRCDWISLTGGEPTLQHDAGKLVTAFGANNFRVIVETNGLRLCDWFIQEHVTVSCSPKLPDSGQDTPFRRERVARVVEARRWQPQWRTQYKFVVTSQEDLKAVVPYCNEVGIKLGPNHSPVYLQPDGYVQPVEKYLEALQWLQENAPRGFRVCPQVHRLVHGPAARGV